MARWQITKDGEPTTDPLFDDDSPAAPGEDGFSTDAVKAHVAVLGPTFGFNYVGVSAADGDGQ